MLSDYDIEKRYSVLGGEENLRKFGEIASGVPKILSLWNSSLTDCRAIVSGLIRWAICCDGKLKAPVRDIWA